MTTASQADLSEFFEIQERMRQRTREQDRARWHERKANETPEQREKRLAYSRDYRTANRERCAENVRDWLRRHPEYEFERSLRRKFGLGRREYDQMLAEQDGACSICGGTDSGKRLAVDHCHETGCIRGLLCSRCNLTIGQSGDDPALLRAMADYVELHQAKEERHLVSQ